MPVMNRPGFWTGSGLSRLFSSGELWNYDENSKEQRLSKQDLRTAKETSSSHSHTLKGLPRSQSVRVELCAGKSPRCETVERGVQIPEDILTGCLTACPEEKRSSEKNGNKETLPPLLNVASSLENVSICPSFSNTPKAKTVTVSSMTGSSFLSNSKELFEDCQKRYEGQRNAQDQELPMTSCANLDAVDTDFAIEAMCDPVILNVQNDQRSQGLLPLSNNGETNHQLTSTGTEECLVSHPGSTIIEPKEAEQTTKTNIFVSNRGSLFSATFVHNTGNSDTKMSRESPSCDDSVSETGDELDAFSSSSDCLTYIEDEEKAVIDGTRGGGNTRFPHFTRRSKNGSQTQPLCLNPARIYHSSLSKPFAQSCIPLVLQMSKPVTRGLSKTTVSEEGLSEILSPVDEVLSYGSYELPPPVAHCAGYGSVSSTLLPPQPAFEVITSEEEFPPSSEGNYLYLKEDPSINSELVLPLPDDKTPHVNNTKNSGETNKDLAEGQNVFDRTENSSLVPADEDVTDLLFSFDIGDRVLVCLSRPGVLKYKGQAAFAGGLWAGVVLDRPEGNHNGTFRGVKYFRCDRNCGVLVRAEDISPLRGTQDSDLDTEPEEDPFSDEEPPNCLKPQEDGLKEDEASGGPLEGNIDREQNKPINDPLTTKMTYKEGQLQEKWCQNPQLDCCNETPEASSSSIPMPVSSLFQIGFDSCPQTAGHNMSSSFDINSWVESLTEELIQDLMMDALELRMRNREKGLLKEDNIQIDASVPAGVLLTVKKKDDSTASKLCFIEQWHDTLCSAAPEKVQIQPHDRDIVYRLVDTALETLLGQAKSTMIYNPEAPGYIIDEESVRVYGRIMHQLTSEILHGVLTNHFGITRSMWQTKNTLSSLLSSRVFLTDLKAAVKSEVQKELNLERTDLQIQELHKEELQWVDYNADQMTVKMRLSEEIFSLLLEDTISVLKHMYMTPSF
ncbi:uncharacterized protein LOC129825935 isoform X3 [Salvelinus fontinalis]|uniref:uncharacterized protein LOC129825935 isoform X3 n=1 Tax=Salvelinus fontinalis TaxID=8038 RepID=UPI00248669D9|nr:uncharacterized protein LOC129825935 isoform X3 [Salvelinus fontinalis]